MNFNNELKISISSSSSKKVTQELAEMLNKYYSRPGLYFKADAGRLPAPEAVWLIVNQPMLIGIDDVRCFQDFCMGWRVGKNCNE